MFTANTMASIAAALGMALPGSASAPAVDRRRDDYAFESGKAVVRLVEAGIRPRQFLTKEAFLNGASSHKRTQASPANVARSSCTILSTRSASSALSVAMRFSSSTVSRLVIASGSAVSA